MKWKGQKQSRNVVRQAPDPAREAKESATSAQGRSSVNRLMAQRGVGMQMLHRANSDYENEVLKQKSYVPTYKLTGKTAGGPSTRAAKNSRPSVPHNDKDFVAWRTKEDAKADARTYTPSERKSSEHRRKNQTAANKLVTSKPTTGVQKRAKEREKVAMKGKRVSLPTTKGKN